MRLTSDHAQHQDVALTASIQSAIILQVRDIIFKGKTLFTICSDRLKGYVNAISEAMPSSIRKYRLLFSPSARVGDRLGFRN